MVEQFARRFGVDLKHARKVAHFALELFHEVLPFQRMAAEMEARKQAMCEAEKAGLAATVAKKISAH